MDGLVDKSKDGRMGWMVLWIDKLLNGWMDRWMDGGSS